MTNLMIESYGMLVPLVRSVSRDAFPWRDIFKMAAATSLISLFDLYPKFAITFPYIS